MGYDNECCLCVEFFEFLFATDLLISSLLSLMSFARCVGIFVQKTIGGRSNGSEKDIGKLVITGVCLVGWFFIVSPESKN